MKESIAIIGKVNVLKFRTLVACQKDLENRPYPDQTASEEAV